jgi:hypothetical protein
MPHCRLGIKRGELRHDKTTRSPTPPYNPDYAWSMPCGPWPKTLLYYDHGAQMMFLVVLRTFICHGYNTEPFHRSS